MERDMDLVKKMLLAIEKKQPSDLRNEDLEIEGYSHQKISYHVKMMAEAGLVEAIDFSNNTTGIDWRSISLTWEGHVFLGTSKDEKQWKKTKQIINRNGLSISVEVLKTLISKLMTDGVLEN